MTLFFKWYYYSGAHATSVYVNIELAVRFFVVRYKIIIQKCRERYRVMSKNTASLIVREWNAIVL